MADYRKKEHDMRPVEATEREDARITAPLTQEPEHGVTADPSLQGTTCACSHTGAARASGHSP
ncbi:magnesium transporter, partial [Desulfovibrio sp. 1188_IL3213]